MTSRPTADSEFAVGCLMGLHHAEDNAMAATAEYACLRCKQPFIARTADRKRGWARFCSKSCKAVRQEQRTGQHAAYLDRKDRRADGYEGGEFSDAHLFSNEDHDCNKSPD